MHDGNITDPATGRSTTYWTLFGGKRFGCQISGLSQPKSPGAHEIIGISTKRLDLFEKVTGCPVYVHDLSMPGILHPRVVRPPHYAARLVSADLDAARQMPGVVQVVRDGSFLAVVAEGENQAINALQTLQSSAVWEGQPDFPPAQELYNHLLNSPAKSSPSWWMAPQQMIAFHPSPCPPGAVQTLSATYHLPYQMHASLSPQRPSLNM